MLMPTKIICEGILKGNVDIEDGPQAELRAAILLHENRMRFPPHVIERAFAQLYLPTLREFSLCSLAS
jgi:hypothetical protein